LVSKRTPRSTMDLTFSRGKILLLSIISHRARTSGPRLARHRLPVTFRCGQWPTARVPAWQKRRVRPADDGPALACHQRPSTLFTQPGQHHFLFYRFFIYCSTVVLFYVYLRVTVTNALRNDGNSGPITIGVGLAPYSLVVTPQMHYVSPRSLKIMNILYIIKTENQKNTPLVIIITDS